MISGESEWRIDHLSKTIEQGINEWTMDQMKQAVIDLMINRSIKQTNDQVFKWTVDQWNK